MKNEAYIYFKFSDAHDDAIRQCAYMRFREIQVFSIIEKERSKRQTVMVAAGAAGLGWEVYNWFERKSVSNKVTELTAELNAEKVKEGNFMTEIRKINHKLAIYLDDSENVLRKIGTTLCNQIQLEQTNHFQNLVTEIFFEFISSINNLINQVVGKIPGNKVHKIASDLCISNNKKKYENFCENFFITNENKYQLENLKLIDADDIKNNKSPSVLLGVRITVPKISYLKILHIEFHLFLLLCINRRTDFTFTKYLTRYQNFL